MDVRVFRNLTRGCYSIQARVGSTWRTVAHADSVTLDSARFHVSEAGRQRVIATGKKTVHAWIAGKLGAWSGNVRIPSGNLAESRVESRVSPPPSAQAVTYNPRRDSSFRLRADSVPVSQVSRAWCDSHGVAVAL
jgi:hypothetical protein